MSLPFVEGLPPSATATIWRCGIQPLPHPTTSEKRPKRAPLVGTGLADSKQRERPLPDQCPRQGGIVATLPHHASSANHAQRKDGSHDTAYLVETPRTMSADRILPNSNTGAVGRTNRANRRGHDQGLCVQGNRRAAFARRADYGEGRK